jgi:hypothetical protein
MSPTIRAAGIYGGTKTQNRRFASKLKTQEPGENVVAIPFQSIGSRGSAVSTLIVRPMTSVGTVGANS